jgi:hypothetical protein
MAKYIALIITSVLLGTWGLSLMSTADTFTVIVGVAVLFLNFASCFIIIWHDITSKKRVVVPIQTNGDVARRDTTFRN